MFVWCNRRHEVVEVVLSEPSQYGPIRDAVEGLAGIVEEAPVGGNIRIFTKKCHCTSRNSIGRNLDAHNMLHLMPVAYEDGWEYYHTFAFRHTDFKRFAKSAERLPSELIVMRKSAINANLGDAVTISVKDLFANLTAKQIEALLTSYFMGYFSFPRKTNVKNIAETKRVPRTTLQEHLTKAENKLIGSLVPYLRLFHAGSMSQSRMTSHRFPQLAG